ncbi:hypothetical protein ABBQ32_002018 [Trebouxia sp. C0010 RCD-2024]
MVGQAAVQARLVSCPQCLLRRKFACFSSSRPRQSLKSETPYSVRCTLPQTAAGLQPGLLVAPRHRTYTRPRQTCCSVQGLQVPAPVAVLAEGLEAPVQLVYLVTLLGFLVVGAYLVVRQALITRELEEAAKTLGDRVRQKDATCEDYFELGVILLRKKLFTQATKNLEKAKKTWNGEPDELAQVGIAQTPLPG